MSRLTKILRTLTIGNLAVAALVLTDIVDASTVPSFYGTFPLGVTCLGMFLISLALDKEVAVFDAEQIERAKAKQTIPLSTPASPERLGEHQTHLDRAA